MLRGPHTNKMWQQRPFQWFEAHRQLTSLIVFFPTLPWCVWLVFQWYKIYKDCRLEFPGLVYSFYKIFMMKYIGQGLKTLGRRYPKTEISVSVGFFTIGQSDAFLSDYLTNLKLQKTK